MLMSASSLVTTIRKVCDTFRFLVVKYWAQALKHFRKCFLLCLHSEEKKQREHFSHSTWRLIFFSIWCGGFMSSLSREGLQTRCLSLPNPNSVILQPLCSLSTGLHQVQGRGGLAWSSHNWVPSCRSLQGSSNIQTCLTEVCFWTDSSHIFAGRICPAAGSAALWSSCLRYEEKWWPPTFPSSKHELSRAPSQACVCWHSGTAAVLHRRELNSPREPENLLQWWPSTIKKLCVMPEVCLAQEEGEYLLVLV